MLRIDMYIQRIFEEDNLSSIYSYFIHQTIQDKSLKHHTMNSLLELHFFIQRLIYDNIQYLFILTF